MIWALISSINCKISIKYINYTKYSSFSKYISCINTYI